MITSKEVGKEVWLVQSVKPLEFVFVKAMANNQPKAIVNSIRGNLLVDLEFLFLSKEEALEYRKNHCEKIAGDLEGQLRCYEERMRRLKEDIDHIKGRIEEYRGMANVGAKEHSE